MLVHICCSVDSHFFLHELKKLYPNEELVGFFYDPNIHPYSEYKLRLMDVQRSCKKLHVKLIEGEYDVKGWLEAVGGYEDEPEKGKRCQICFDNRLEVTAKKALELGFSSITTTLLTSPKKSIAQLKASALEIEKKYNLKVLTPDFRLNGGTARQFELAKEDMLYHQNYCGCLYALEKQRFSQKKLNDEMSSPLSNRTLPASIEERIELYEKVHESEEKGEKFSLKREKFLNYRLLSAYVKKDKMTIPSYFLFYSHSKRKHFKGKIASFDAGVGEFSKESVLFVSLEYFNKYANSEYKSVKQMIFNPPSLKTELSLRKNLQGEFFSLSPIIIIDTLTEDKLEIGINSVIYDDVRELLVKFR